MPFDLFQSFAQSPPLIFATLAATFLALIFCAVTLVIYGPAIKRLNKLEVISQLYSLGEQQREMTSAFGRATAASNTTMQTVNELRNQLEALQDFIVEAQEKMSEYNADRITKSRIEQEDEALPEGTFFKNFRNLAGGMAPPQTPDGRFQSMKSEWAKFLDAFKARLVEANITPQLNRIGKMTYMLTDKRRKQPLPVETADLITALHSQYRRYLALHTVSPEGHDEFVRLVKTAIDELKLSLTSSQSVVRGNTIQPPQPQTVIQQ
jgi:hypothetical protein